MERAILRLPITLRIPTARLLARARRVWPDEACGVLLRPQRRAAADGSDAGAPAALRFVGLPNRAPRHARRGAFRLDPLHLVRVDAVASRTGFRLAGVGHSHPEAGATAHPSEADRAPGWVRSWQLVAALPEGPDGPAEAVLYRVRRDGTWSAVHRALQPTRTP